MKRNQPRHLLAALFAAALLAASAVAAAAEKLERLTLAGPFAAVSNPLVRMVASGALDDVAEEVEFVTWKDPDQLRALLIKGDVDFVAVPTNVGANLHNRGVDLRLLNVSVWGVLWMISRDADREGLADFRGEEIAVPFRGDMPDIVMSELMRQAGLDPKKDFELRYVASPLDAMQLLIMRRVDHALLAEPAVSMALRKTRSFPVSVIAPDLHRSVDLQAEWGRVFDQEPSLPQAGMAVVGRHLPDSVIERFLAEYDKALQWCLAHPQEAGTLVAARIDLLTPEAVADSIATSQLRHVPAAAARAELERFFGVLAESEPALIGGKLPDAGFYYGQ